MKILISNILFCIILNIAFFMFIPVNFWSVAILGSHFVAGNFAAAILFPEFYRERFDFLWTLTLISFTLTGYLGFFVAYHLKKAPTMNNVHG